MGTEVAWVAPYPAHYNRAFHVALENRWPGTFTFLYVCRSGRRGRSYEAGELPRNSWVLEREKGTDGLLRIVQKIADVDPSIVVVNGHAPPPLSVVILWALARGRNLVYRSDTSLIDVLRHRSWMKRLFHKVLGRTVLSGAAALLPIGSQNRSYYRWSIGSDFEDRRTFRVPYPHAMPPGWESGRSGEPDVVTFLYLGRLASEKGIDELIRAAELLDRAVADWRLRIAGDGPEREGLEELVRDRGLVSRVEFLGEVDSSVRGNVFAEADVFVLPSHREPWGLVVNEALSAGLPVIAPYWVGAATDLLIDGYNGRLLASNRPPEIARAMRSFLQDPEQISGMGGRGRETVATGGWTREGALEGIDGLLGAFR